MADKDPDDEKWLGIAVQIMVWGIFLGAFVWLIVGSLTGSW